VRILVGSHHRHAPVPTGMLEARWRERQDRDGREVTAPRSRHRHRYSGTHATDNAREATPAVGPRQPSPTVVPDRPHGGPQDAWYPDLSMHRSELAGRPPGWPAIRSFGPRPAPRSRSRPPGPFVPGGSGARGLGDRRGLAGAGLERSTAVEDPLGHAGLRAGH